MLPVHRPHALIFKAKLSNLTGENSSLRSHSITVSHSRLPESHRASSKLLTAAAPVRQFSILSESRNQRMRLRSNVTTFSRGYRLQCMARSGSDKSDFSGDEGSPIEDSNRNESPSEDLQQSSNENPSSESETADTAKMRDWRAVQMNLITNEVKTETEYMKKLVKRKRRYLPFQEARLWARGLSMKSEQEWDEMCNDGRRNPYIPSDPALAYKDQGWLSWDDWLGIVHFKQFSDARAYARSLRLTSATAWYEWIREGNLPEDIPERPMQVYKEQGWISFEDWLGL